MRRPQDELEFSRAYDRITDAYIALDADWRYTHVNPKAAEMLGRAPGSLVGRHIWSEFPSPPDDPFRRAYETAMAEQRVVTVQAYSTARHRWFENRIYPSADGLTISFLDINDRKRAEILDAGRQEILSDIVAQEPLADSLEKIAKLHETLNPGALCSVLLLDADRRHVRHGAAPSLPDAYNKAIDGLEIGDHRGSCGTAAWRRERVVVEDIATDPDWADYRELALAHGLQACWSTPVFGSYEQVLGTFAVYYLEKRRPSREELESIDRMLPITAIAIEGEQAAARLRERDYFFDMSQEIYCIFDTQRQRIVQSNPTFSAATGFSAEELASRHYLEFVHPDDVPIATGAVSTLTGAGMRVSEVTYRFLCKDGDYRWLSWESIVGPNGLAFAVARDVTGRQQAAAALAFADTHDALTGLPNRSLLEGAIQALIDGGKQVWVLFLGMDRFHSINESMGHVIGDKVLGELAHRLRDAMGTTGTLGRFAGDQFALAVGGIDEAAAISLAQELRDAISRPIEEENYRLVLTASAGISHSPEHGTNPQDLLQRAEAAMGRAKLQGRDATCLFSAQQMRDIEERLQLGNLLRGAVKRGEMTLHYQPQHRARGRALTGFEALLRWNVPDRGWIPPDRFIPIAEVLGLMPEIGQFVLDAACRQAREWLDRDLGGFTIAVNVSAQELQRPGLAGRVDEALRRHSLPAGVLGLELTESSLVENVERARATLEDLERMGVRLALDDFGTGYSSLAYLKHFPIQKLKIDQSFVRGLPDAVDDAAIARTIVAMAHQLGMLVSAEGVETQAQAAFLQGIGCDELQGYLLGRPVPADEVEPGLRARDA